MSSRRAKVCKDKRIESSDEKKILAYHVSLYPCLWRLTDANYSNRDANCSAWLEISEKMLRDVGACKAAWISLRDSLRYRTGKKKKNGKSGDSLEDAQLDDDETIVNNDDNLKLWEYFDVMKFMIEDGPQRKTMSTPLNVYTGLEQDNLPQSTQHGDDGQGTSLNDSELEVAHREPEGVNQDDVQMIEAPVVKKRPPAGSYQYIPKKIKRDTETKSADDRIADSIHALVEARKASQSTTHVPEEKLKYYSIFLNLDRMLQKVPENVVEELNFKFICLIRDELQQTPNTSE